MKCPNREERLQIMRAVLTEEEQQMLSYELADVTVKVKLSGVTASYKFKVLPEETEDLFANDED